MARGDFSVATFNLYNLNRPGLPIYGGDGWSQDQYDRKIAWVAGRLLDIDVDVIGFQELWHREALEDAFAAGALGDAYDLLIPPEAQGGRIVCAAAVRKGLLEGEPEWIAAFPDKFRLQSAGDDPQTPEIAVSLSGFHRPVLHFTARLRDDRAPVHFYVAHLKSKAPTAIWREDWYEADRDAYRGHTSELGAALSTIRRTAEAGALRWIVTEMTRGSDEPVIVLGDLNDGQHSNTLNILTGQPRFLRPGTTGGGSDSALYSAQALQQLQSLRDVYYTHIYNDVHESLDHVLVSEQFYDFSRKRIWDFDELVIVNDHLDRDDHKDAGTNDHGIVKVSFRYRPA